MANLEFIIENRIRQELTEDIAECQRIRSLRRRRLYHVGLPILTVLLFFNSQLFFLGVISCFFVFVATGQYTHDASKLSGLKGEDRALELLQQLPYSYTVFNQVLVPDDNSSTGFREIDYLLCGPNGLFAIEVKNNNGTIHGSESSEHWMVCKVGRMGGTYETSMRNPVRQLKAQIHVLSKYLGSKGVRAWINGLVVFTNSDCYLRVEESRFPVMNAEQLVQYIIEFTPERPVRNVGHAVRVVAGLVDNGVVVQAASVACT